MIARRLEGRAARGSAMVITLVTILLLAGLSVSYVDTIVADGRRADASVDEIQADNIALTGLRFGVNEVRAGQDYDGQGLGNHSADFGGGHFTVSTVQNGAFRTITSTGEYRGAKKTVEALIRSQSGGIYWYAIFAGNEGGNLSYDLRLNGQGASGDNIVGAVYSGSDLTVDENATIRNAISSDPNYIPGLNAPIPGDAKAAGVINNNNGQIEGGISKGTEAAPELNQADYENNAIADFDSGKPWDQVEYIHVSKVLQRDGTSGYWSKGGTAIQITDPDNPAHIFRVNPSERTSINNSTPGDDYYIEDPTVTNSAGLKPGSSADYDYNGNNAFHVKVSPEGTGKVYFIDGNLHINNRYTYALVMKHNEAGPGIKMTFAVKGNIYIGDNLYLQNKVKDGLAFIALKNPAIEATDPGTTGNVHLGDPLFGTTHKIDAFLYAENNFIDNNLDESGSDWFQIYGNMTAGNEVAIQRDYFTPGHWEYRWFWNRRRRRWERQWYWVEAEAGHARMDVFFDPRIRDDPDFRAAMPKIPLPRAGVSQFDWFYTISKPPAP